MFQLNWFGLVHRSRNKLYKMQNNCAFDCEIFKCKFCQKRKSIRAKIILLVPASTSILNFLSPSTLFQSLSSQLFSLSTVLESLANIYFIESSCSLSFTWTTFSLLKPVQPVNNPIGLIPVPLGMDHIFLFKGKPAAANLSHIFGKKCKVLQDGSSFL